MLRLFFLGLQNHKFKFSQKHEKAKTGINPFLPFQKRLFCTKNLGFRECCREAVHMEREAAFEVGRFIFVDIVVFRQFVQHRNDLDEESASFSRIFHLAELFHARAGGLFVITVDKAAFFGLPDALFSGCVVSHFIF